MEPKRILVINLGSTSTKIAYFEDTECLIRENVTHDAAAIQACKEIRDQLPLRRAAVVDFMEAHNISLDDLDAIAPRGGNTSPIPGGTWAVNEKMIEESLADEYGIHPCNLGVAVAYSLCRESDHAVALTTDTPTTDEMEPLARYSGLKEVTRRSSVQMLNVKAMARYWAGEHGIPFAEARLIVCMLGGGIGVVGIRDGRAIDAPNGLAGEGPFSNNRCGTVPVGDLVDMCFESGRTHAEMIRHVNGEAGLVSYLGTTDLREIMARIEGGDEYAREVIEAMCYQTAKDIGGMATVLEGTVDATLVIGGMANVPFITGELERRCGWIAPFYVLAGEREMESLAEGAYEALTGARPIQQFVGA